jgi:hypothetical protein
MDQKLHYNNSYITLHYAKYRTLQEQLLQPPPPLLLLQLVCSRPQQTRALADTSYMIRSILLVLGSRLEEGGQLQEPPPFADSYKAEHSLLSYTDAKATEHGAWIGGYK